MRGRLLVRRIAFAEKFTSEMSIRRAAFRRPWGHFARSGSERYRVESGRCAGVSVTSVRANKAAVPLLRGLPDSSLPFTLC